MSSAAPPAKRVLAVSEGVNVLALSFSVSDKLQLLDYENAFCKGRPFAPFDRFHFAKEPTARSGHFALFAALSLWILKDLVGADVEPWSEFEDPNTVCAAIATELRKLGMAAEFPVSKLRRGAGDAACLCLDFALTKALERKGFRVARPRYEEAGAGGADAGDGGGGGDAEDEDGDVDEVEDEVLEDERAAHSDDDDEDDGVGGEGRPRGAGQFSAASGAAGASGDDAAMQEVIEANVDPAVWAMELAAVAPMLKYRSAASTKEWRTHIEQAEKHGALMGETFPAAAATLEKVGAELKKAADRISAKERHINKEFEALGRDFREKQSELDAMQERYNELSENVAELTEELASKSEAVEHLQASMADRNNSMTDTSPVRKISAALADVKKELAAMELRIGVAMQSLLHHTVKATFGGGAGGAGGAGDAGGKRSSHERSVAHMDSIGRGGEQPRYRGY